MNVSLKNVMIVREKQREDYIKRFEEVHTKLINIMYSKIVMRYDNNSIELYDKIESVMDGDSRFYFFKIENDKIMGVDKEEFHKYLRCLNFSYIYEGGCLHIYVQ